MATSHFPSLRVTDVMNISETHIKCGYKIFFRKNMFNRIK